MNTRLVNKLKTSATCVALATGMMLSTAAVADEVTLKSADGTVNLVGEFVEFKDDNYVIRTALGDLRISASRVRCEGAACPQLDNVTVDVQIAGSDTIGLGMMPLLMSGFAATLDADAELVNTAAGQTIATLVSDGGFGDEIGSYLVSATSDDDAFSALLGGSAKVGMSSRRITKDEARALRAEGAGNMVSPNQEHIVAIDSMVVVTHPSNTVGELTVEQLRGIFSGQIKNWQQVGGPNGDINVIGQDPQSSGYEFFMNYLYGENRPNFVPQGIASDDQSASNVVYQDRNAISYVGFAFQRGAQPVTVVNECGIASKPDAFSAKTEEYALNRRMYLYNRADNLDEASQSFINFAVSEAADGVIGKSGFIDLGIVRRGQGEDDARSVALQKAAAAYDAGFESGVVREMLEEMQGNDRLSTTFRFRTGSAKLDERGRLDLARLTDYLETAPQGTKVTFVGFTDSVGTFEANRRLSLGRAASVLEEVRRVSGDRVAQVEFASTGFGEIAPSACNDSDRGKEINRRVEVWISSDSAT